VKFTTSYDEPTDEWILQVHHPNGSYAGIGALNGELEARLVCKSLNESLSDFHELCRWRDYFEDSSQMARRAGKFAWEP